MKRWRWPVLREGWGVSRRRQRCPAQAAPGILAPSQAGSSQRRAPDGWAGGVAGP